MRLLHTTKLRFEEFFDAATPKYAILSHRWHKNEISHQEFKAAMMSQLPTDVISKIDVYPASCAKIMQCRAIAAQQKISWVWIDTCCIDRESSSELSETINSMYRWYENADVCYAYLSDVLRNVNLLPSEMPDNADLEVFMSSEWFTRGWTLQELLAPRGKFVFYDKRWVFFGDRNNNLATYIAAETGIGIEYIRGQKSVHEASVAERMSWGSGRETTRAEDMAYRMQGLFNINMPLLYGEGQKAFMRLQTEIIKKDEDESIFAWRRSSYNLSHQERLQVTKLDTKHGNLNDLDCTTEPSREKRRTEERQSF